MAERTSINVLLTSFVEDRGLDALHVTLFLKTTVEVHGVTESSPFCLVERLFVDEPIETLISRLFR